MLDDILNGCRNRQRDSQKRLYEMFYGYGMSITLYYADSRNEAAEILNDGFMKVFTNIGSFDSNRPFKPWFRRILINTAIDHYHKHKKHKQTDTLELHESDLLTSEKILSGIAYREIITMIQQLTPAYRTVFNLCIVEGYKHKEVAKMLDISVGTSKSNLHKAKQNLQAMLEKKCNVEL